MTFGTERQAYMENRFWSKVKPRGNCLVWVASKYPNGYGAFKLNKKTHGAHRVAYKLTVGEIPRGILVCHSCDNPPCVNPEHLFLGTYSDNTWDALNKGRAVIPPGYKPQPIKHGSEWAYKSRCRCNICKEAYAKIRRQKYLRTGT